MLMGACCLAHGALATAQDGQGFAPLDYARVHAAPEILRLLEDRFFVFAFENESFGGIAELLSVLKTVVYEWEEPLSQDQRQFFVRSVV